MTEKKVEITISKPRYCPNRYCNRMTSDTKYLCKSDNTVECIDSEIFPELCPLTDA